MNVDAYRHEIARLENENRELKAQLEKGKSREPEKGKYMDREAKVSEER